MFGVDAGIISDGFSQVFEMFPCFLLVSLISHAFMNLDTLVMLVVPDGF